VRFTYNRIRCEMRGDENKLFYKLWKVKTLSSAQFCAWRVMLDKLPTVENLEKIGIIVTNSKCIIC